MDKQMIDINKLSVDARKDLAIKSASASSFVFVDELDCSESMMRKPTFDYSIEELIESITLNTFITVMRRERPSFYTEVCVEHRKWKDDGQFTSVFLWMQLRNDRMNEILKDFR